MIDPSVRDESSDTDYRQSDWWTRRRSCRNRFRWHFHNSWHRFMNHGVWNRFTGCRFMVLYTVKNRFISDARSCQPERSSVDSWFWSWRFIDRCHYRLWECSLAYLVSLAIETCLGSPICPDIPNGTKHKEQTVSLSTAWKCGNVQQLFSALVQPWRTFH